jgi:hypothetical protein
MTKIYCRITYVLCGSALWYYIGTRDKKLLKTTMYNKGYNLSQKFKLWPAWDIYAEPLIINQFSILFTAGNAFIKGLISDNENDIKSDIDKYVTEVKSELGDFGENNTRE